MVALGNAERRPLVPAANSTVPQTTALVAAAINHNGGTTTLEKCVGRAAMTGLSQRANVDLAAFVRINPYDQSCLWQFDASWHVWPQSSVYATVGGFAGAANSEFGANPLRMQIALRLEPVF